MIMRIQYKKARGVNTSFSTKKMKDFDKDILT